MTSQGIKALKAILQNEELLEVARRAVEDELVERRNARIAVLRNNGLVIKEMDGTSSTIIRLGTEHALKIGLNAIIQYEEKSETRARVTPLLQRKRQMKIVYPTGAEAELPQMQHDAVIGVATRHKLAEPITVHPLLAGDGCVMIQVPNMWIGVETDGYAHT
jgi:hypothetical protein